jgi:hypothetical protein
MSVARHDPLLTMPLMVINCDPRVTVTVQFIGAHSACQWYTHFIYFLESALFSAIAKF